MVVLLVIVLVLYEARSLMNTILLTFIFTYLIVHWVRLVQRWIPRVPVTLVVLLSYLLLILGLFTWSPITCRCWSTSWLR